MGKYHVWTSSGTSGVPAVFVHDERALAVYDPLETVRFRRLRPENGRPQAACWANVMHCSQPPEGISPALPPRRD